MVEGVEEPKEERMRGSDGMVVEWVAVERWEEGGGGEIGGGWRWRGRIWWWESSVVGGDLNRRCCGRRRRLWKPVDEGRGREGGRRGRERWVVVVE